MASRVALDSADSLILLAADVPGRCGLLTLFCSVRWLAAIKAGGGLHGAGSIASHAQLANKNRR